MSVSGIEIIPAIDIRNGKCVRLVEGRPEAETVFSNDPLQTAVSFEEMGARRLHVVDLDGAFRGRPVNDGLVMSLAGSVSIPVQVGGGVRSSEAIRRYLEGGVERVIVGTCALSDPGWLRGASRDFGERLAVGLDARGGEVVVGGWTRSSGSNLMDALDTVEQAGVSRLIFTSVARDGTLGGPDIQALEGVLARTTLPVIASGGVRNVEDLELLAGFGERGLEGAVVGMAIYTGRLDLAEALSRLGGEG